MNDTEMKHIVVIDDDPVIVKILEKKLNDQGCRVTVATDAPEGLQMVMNQKPDAVILDVMMPIINGYNICHLIKSEEDTKNIPIILLTSRNEQADVQIGLDMGADAYLLKPLDSQELFKIIKTIFTSSDV